MFLEFSIFCCTDCYRQDKNKSYKILFCVQNVLLCWSLSNTLSIPISEYYNKSSIWKVLQEDPTTFHLVMVLKKTATRKTKLKWKEI